MPSKPLRQTPARPPRQRRPPRHFHSVAHSRAQLEFSISSFDPGQGTLPQRTFVPSRIVSPSGNANARPPKTNHHLRRRRSRTQPRPRRLRHHPHLRHPPPPTPSSRKLRTEVRSHSRPLPFPPHFFPSSHLPQIPVKVLAYKIRSCPHHLPTHNPCAFAKACLFAPPRPSAQCHDFEPANQKPKTACFNNGHRIEDHFVGANEMIEPTWDATSKKSIPRDLPFPSASLRNVHSKSVHSPFQQCPSSQRPFRRRQRNGLQTTRELGGTMPEKLPPADSIKKLEAKHRKQLPPPPPST
jgi:hypothetical protein